MSYIPCSQIADFLPLEEGDTIFISSDVSRLALEALQNNDLFDPTQFISSVQEKIGKSGTLLFPAYNWDFCKGVPFDYYKTPCKTGSLSKAALHNINFKRTKHPIYSFSVWGKDQDYLCSLDNHSSFGSNSPFAYFHKVNTKNIIIDSELKNNFTFVHYVEEKTGNVSYRYLKKFTGNYTDKDGITTQRTYSMFVRNLDLNVINTINPLESLLISHHAAEKKKINSVFYTTIQLGNAYPLIKNDIVNNNSRNICTFWGQ